VNLIDKNKRYNTIDRYYKQKYGKKVAKISLNGNFSCPNKDGTKGFGGCIFCSKSGSGDFAGNKELNILEQFEEIKDVMNSKWPDSLYMPYLQANSNTYGTIEKLKEVYEPLTTLKDVVGISIATRADCFNEEIYNYLDDLNKRIPLQIELGLQTIHQKTAKLINRGVELDEFETAVKRLREINIEVVVHIINGLPHETKDDMLETVKYLNKLDIQGIKIHCLLILKNTPLETYYQKTNFKMLTLEEYVDITVSQIEHLRDDIIIHRVGADSSLEDLIEPLWSRKKLVVMNEIDKLLRKKDSYQGILLKRNI
jgi:radical SAM protein (TIGR01212 family)